MAAPASAPTTIADLLDREAIRDCLYRYCRGIDRRDEGLLKSVYWPEATDDHGSFSGPAKDFIAWVLALLEDLEQTTHALHNILIVAAGQRAASEACFTAYHRRVLDGQPTSFTVGGRYLDILEKRSGEWRILERKVMLDWLEENAAAPQTLANVLGIELSRHAYPSDDSYRLFAEGRLTG